MASAVVWSGIIAKPFPAKCRAVLEESGTVRFEVSSERASLQSRHWLRLRTVPPEFLTHVAVMLLVEQELDLAVRA